MAVQENLLPTHKEKSLGALKAERAVKRITFDRTETKPEETLFVYVPKLNENDVIVPGSLALRFNIDLNGGHANNFLVDNVSRALVDKLTMKYAGEVLQDTVGFDIYKIYEDLFLSKEERDNIMLDGIKSEDLNKIRSNAGDKKTSGVNVENKLSDIYGTKYRIRLDHQILTDHGAFYPQALFNELVFELKLAPASQVFRGSDPSKLKYKLTNIQLEYEMIRSNTLADEARSVYSSGKEICIWSHSAGRSGNIRKRHWHKAESKSKPTEKVSESHLAPICRALYCWHKALRSVLKPRPDKSQRHSQRLAEHAVQQRTWRNWYLGGGQTFLCQRKK